MGGRLGARLDRVVPVSRLLGGATVAALATWLDAGAAGAVEPDRLAAVSVVHARHGYLSGRYSIDDDAVVSPSGLPATYERHTGDRALLDARLRAPLDLESGLVWRSVLVRPPRIWLGSGSCGGPSSPGCPR